MVKNNDRVLIYDIECSCPSGKPDPNKDILKLFGCYSYITKKYYYLVNKEQIIKIIKQHDFIVGFNNIKYDNAVLYNNGFSQDMRKNDYGDCSFKGTINIDLMDILKKRAPAMKVKAGMLGDLLMSFSLDFVTKIIGLVTEEDGKIKDFDYSVLAKDSWTAEEIIYIKDYLKRDLDVTMKLYEWLENYFDSFKTFVRQKDIDRKTYLTCSTATFAYKAACKAMDIKEEYDSTAVRDESFGGGYVALPICESFKGNILLFDFSSLYPNLFIMGNLFGNDCKCCTHDEKWSGDEFFKMKGSYCTKKLAKAGEMLKKFYLDRVEMKKAGDNREYSCKIIINSLYGAVSNPVFKNIYNLTAAEDCTSLGRQFILYARKRFREEGYVLLMSDTDSIAVQVPDDKSKQDAQLLADYVVNELLTHMPFAW